MTKSMTGFAAHKGSFGDYSWNWDMRAVNARGIDVRLRLPDWVDGLEQPLRQAIQKQVARGNINLTLKVTKDAAGQGGLIDEARLRELLNAIHDIENTALSEHNLELSKTSAADILAMRSTGDTAASDDTIAALRKALLADLNTLLGMFEDMRVNEGRSLHSVIAAQLEQIQELTTKADGLTAARQDATAARLADNLKRVLDNSDGADPDRVAQELALLAVKADITEEIDRLHAHVVAAQGLLAADEPSGRKLDFLTQEFNREANTLCSKAHSQELTHVGLDLKAVIEQMREQVQNVE